MHISEGDLRAYLDGQLDENRFNRIEAHVQMCGRCQSSLKELERRAVFTTKVLKELGAPTFPTPLTEKTARSRLAGYIIEKEKNSMPNRFNAYRTRLVFGAALLIVLVAVMAVPQVRVIATNFLGLFRVEQVAVIPINPAAFDGNFSDMGPQFEQLLAADVKVEQSGQDQTVDNITEASALVDFPLRLPSGYADPSKIAINAGAQVEYTVDLPRLRAILGELGQDTSYLSDSLDRATIVGDIPVSAVFSYGECKQSQPFDPHERQSPVLSDCKVLIQLPSPTISAPPGLDVDAIALAYLQATGMSEREALRFSERIDWATTLVIPIPSDANSRDIQVDGVQGILVESRYNHYMLIWVKDGIMYALSGNGDNSSAIQMANSLVIH